MRRILRDHVHLCRHLREGGLARGEAGDQGSQSWIIPIGLPTANLELYKDKAKTMLKVKKTRLMACQDRIDFQVQGKNLLMMTMTLRDDKR